MPDSEWIKHWQEIVGKGGLELKAAHAQVRFDLTEGVGRQQNATENTTGWS